jgi:hypothetical protein
MFKTAIVASALLQVSSTKIVEQDHTTKAVNAQMVEAINVRFNHFVTLQEFEIDALSWIIDLLTEHEDHLEG